MPEDEIGWTDQEFTAPNGWKVIFYDAGELDYIDSFITSDGQKSADEIAACKGNTE